MTNAAAKPFKKPLGDLGKQVEATLRTAIEQGDTSWDAKSLVAVCLASSSVTDDVKATLKKGRYPSICNTMKRVAKEYANATIEGNVGGSFKVTYTA